MDASNLAQWCRAAWADRGTVREFEVGLGSSLQLRLKLYGVYMSLGFDEQETSARLQGFGDLEESGGRRQFMHHRKGKREIHLPGLLLPVGYVFLLACSSAFGSSPSYILTNNKVTVHFDARGLQSIYDQGLKRTFQLSHDEFALKIDGQEILSQRLNAPTVRNEASSLVYSFEADLYKVCVTYELKPGWGFVSKQLAVTSSSAKQTFRVDQVEVISNRLGGKISSVLVAQSPWSGFEEVLTRDYGVFVRFADRTGMFMLVQNPFLEVHHNGDSFALDYSPDMDWKTEYGPFESDRGCVGVYALTGHMLPTELIPEWKWIERSRSEEPAQDRAENAAFMDCVRAFVMNSPQRSSKIHVGWTENDYQIDLSTTVGREEYKRIIDQAVELGCDRLLFAPSNTALAQEKYDTDSWHWEHVLWLGLGQRIRRGEWSPESDQIPASVQELLDYARSKNIKLVAYAYPILPFVQNPEWLVGENKNAASLASRSLQDWLIKTMLSFYRRTGIGGYSFDYAFLWLPGATQYAQWWGWRRVMASLRSAEPDMIIDGRQAYQYYGPWIWLAGSYPHPTSTDEQAESFTPFPDLHFDRVSADRERYTAYWYRIRNFCPPELMPGYIGHITPRNDEQGRLVTGPFRRRDWDFLGWRYSLISSIAVGGLNNVVNMIPARDLEEYKNFSEADTTFFNHWLHWTDENRKYLLNTRFIIGQPAIGRVDGTSAVVADRGYIFLFNPNGRKLDANFTLDDSIGLREKKSYVLREIYPIEGRLIGKPQEGFWQYGNAVSLTLDGASVLALKVEPAPQTLDHPMLFNSVGAAELQAGKLSLTGIEGEFGTSVNLITLLPENQRVTVASVNGSNAKFTQMGKAVTLSVRFAGQYFGHMQPVGRFEPNFTGGTYTGDARIPPRVFAQLKARQEAWPIPWTKQDLETPWLAPQRLLLFVQIADPNDQMEVQMKLDGETMKLKKAYSSIRPHAPSFVGFYLDASSLKPDHNYKVELNLPKLKPGQFQGIFFDNVEPEYTGRTKTRPD